MLDLFYFHQQSVRLLFVIILNMPIANFSSGNFHLNFSKNHFFGFW